MHMYGSYHVAEMQLLHMLSRLFRAEENFLLG